MKKYGFGVDVGGTTCKLGLFDMSGELLEKWEIATDKSDKGGRILPNIASAIREKMTKRGISKEEVEGIGLDVPGPVGKDGTVYSCVNLGWGTFNVEQEFSGITGMKVKVGNDANVAALGEMWKGGGAGAGNANLVMITLGTGVGGAVIIDGNIYSGTHGAAGEIGHIHVSDEETEACGCGNRGCLEQYASATGIVRMATKKLEKTQKPTRIRNILPLTAKDIFDAAKENDEVAVELVDDLYRILGKTLAQVSCVADPAVIIIGGGVSKAGEILLSGIRKYYQEYAFHACRNAVIKGALLGNDAGICGCVRMLFSE